MLISTAYATLVKCSKTTVNGIARLYATIKNLRGTGNVDTDVKIAFPYGQGGYVPPGRQAVVLPIYGGNKSYAITGYLDSTLDGAIPHTSAEGESWIYSKKYVLNMQLNGIRAYRVGDQQFNATMPIGESMVKLFDNRIHEIRKIYVELTQEIIHKFNLHTHVAPPVGGETAPPVPQYFDLPVPDTLSKDTNYLLAGKALVNDQGEVYS